MKLDEIAQQPALDKQEILAILAKLKISKSRSTINADGSVDVNGDVRLPSAYTKIPFQFRTVSGDFICYRTKIRSLKGAPQWVGGSFDCSSTKVESLEYAPQYIGSDFWCSDTQIKSLHNIHKTNSNWVIGNRLALPQTCTHILGLAFIKGVKMVSLGGLEATPFYLVHDVFEWQEKLLEMGLVEQAQL
jgi:hypothetical protein